MDKRRRIDYLLNRYTSGLIDAREKQELLELYREVSDEQAEYPDNRESVSERMLARLNNEIQTEKTKPQVIKHWKIVAAVAAIFISIGILMFRQPLEKTESIAKQPVKTQAILPGTNVAVLTLGNGQQIVLNASAKGKLAVQGNTVITKNAAGQVTYKVNAGDVASAEMPVTYNTITTPAGGQFRITLPDGSDVWLNAASSLTYPSRFAGNIRHVELHGEAYFEIHKDKNAPFTVTAETVNIKVLGTHFNVMAYNNEPSVNTTLLEGSVDLSVNNTHKLLVPGQQAVADRAANKLSLQTVNVEDAIAWKNGYFSFRKANLKTAMNKVARWYNVDIEYKGDVSDKTLGGTVSREENITELLNYLELTGIATFKIEGRRIIVICK